MWHPAQSAGDTAQLQSRKQSLVFCSREYNPMPKTVYNMCHLVPVICNKRVLPSAPPLSYFVE